MSELRRTELLTSLAAIRGRIADACSAAGRETSSVTLVAVTKTYPAADVLELAELGVYDVAESRDQEARAKQNDVHALALQDPAGQRAAAHLRWHFVGRLQRKKARTVAGYAFAVHSVDRPELVDLLGDGVGAAGRPPLEVFVQLSLDGDPGRGGVSPKKLLALADLVTATSTLVLRGVMAVAPLGADPDLAFSELAAVAARLRERHPQADAISAGMSPDFEAAIRHGATHLRIGTALLGERSPAVR